METPKLRGKTVAIFARHRSGMPPIVLSDCFLETRGERMFIVGAGMSTHQGAPEWTDGARRSVAWDAVEEYLLFDTPEDYYTRAKQMSASEEMPAFAMPQSSEGYPVEPSGIQMQPETPLEIGTIVLACSHGQWWRAEVIGLEGDEIVRIHYPGWGPEWDVAVPKIELQVYLGDSIAEEE